MICIDKLVMQFCYQDEIEDNADIFKLNFDCFGAIFDCLAITDVFAVAQTCKSLYQMVNSYFHNSLTSSIVLYSHNGSYLTEYNLVINDILLVRRKLLIENNNLRFFHCMTNSLWTLKGIYYNGVNFNDSRISLENHILCQIETIEINKCEFNGNLYRKLLKHCRNLKRLCVQFPKIKNNTKWLLRHYPNLEHIELRGCKFTINDLIKFFNKNQQVQSFNGHLAIGDLKKLADNSNVSLDELHMHLEPQMWQRFQTTEILNQLHEEGFYNRLNLRFYKGISQKIIREIATLKALDTLHITLRGELVESIDLSPLDNVKSLDLDVADDIFIYMETIAHGLSNLQQISLVKADASLIMAFVLNSKKLKTMIIRRVSESGVLPLADLNERRRNITKQKVTIFVGEQFFLKIKYDTGRTKFDLIEIKRF